MKAAVTTRAGAPAVIEIQDVPKPVSKPGWVLIRIMAFGLNRSELFTRRGDSPDVTFPRIQGIECVGLVEDDPGHTFEKGQKVAAMMGGMGRTFDGSYAEFCLVPAAIISPFTSNLSWSILGAIPEMFQTVSGSLNQALEIKNQDILLIRGGTSSIGLLSCQLAKTLGAKVIATTRNPDKSAFLKNNGADKVLIDNGAISEQLREQFPEGVDKVLELIGTSTLKDSLKCIGYKGTVCMTGILGNEWTLPDFTPMVDIPSMGKLTVYMGESKNLPRELLQDFIDEVERENIQLNISTVFQLEQIVEAHELMENNLAKGKLVVKV